MHILLFLLPAGLALLLAGAGCPVLADDGAELAPGLAGASTGHEQRAHQYLDADPPDWDRARKSFLAAAEAGSPTAMSYLGWLYEEGHGVAADGEQAAAWYARAAQAGAHDFAIKLGWMYLGGQGVERDRTAAESWFMKAVAAGYSPGRIAWASVLIADALGGRNPERVHEARELLELALAEGHVLASFFLARIYIEGIGGHPTDDSLALRYTRLGAEAGHAQMQGWLAFMYFHGRGVPEDPVTAATWANLAAAGGDRLGNDLRLALEAQLSPQERDAARRKAVDWALSQR